MRGKSAPHLSQENFQVRQHRGNLPIWMDGVSAPVLLHNQLRPYRGLHRSGQVHLPTLSSGTRTRRAGDVPITSPDWATPEPKNGNSRRTSETKYSPGTVVTGYGSRFTRNLLVGAGLPVLRARVTGRIWRVPETKALSSPAITRWNRVSYLLRGWDCGRRRRLLLRPNGVPFD